MEMLLEDEMCAVLRADDPLSRKNALHFSDLKNSHVIYPTINTNGIVARKLRDEGFRFGRQTNLVTADASITLSVISRRGGVPSYPVCMSRNAPGMCALYPWSPG